jgi:hypothetical protein
MHLFLNKSCPEQVGILKKGVSGSGVAYKKEGVQKLYSPPAINKPFLKNNSQLQGLATGAV